MISTGRPVIAGISGMVSSGHYLASSAAHDILMAGGNAIDAGCAAGLVLGVVQSDIVNIGGVAPMMIRLAGTGKIISIDGLGYWPAALPQDYFRQKCKGEIPVGVHRSVIPAAPDAWITALKLYGSMSFAEVASAAIRHARGGFVVYPMLAESLASHRIEYDRWPSNREIYLPRGAAPKVGDVFVQSDLARTLQYMADEESAFGRSREDGLEAARRAFYLGDIARTICDYYAVEGGFLSRADMAGYHSRHEPVLMLNWRDLQVVTCGPWCQGPVLLQALRLLEGADFAVLRHNSAPMIHLVTEALKLAFADREYHYGDPAFVNVPMAELLSDSHTARRLAQIDPDRAMADLPSALLPSHGGAADLPLGTDQPRVEPDTSYVAVVDRHGNAFSATPSDGSWSVPVIPGLGLVASSRGSQSRTDPSHPACARAGKRPRLTPNPAMVICGNEVMPFGTPGGDVQSQAMLQVLLNRYVYGMDIQAAIEMPRFATYSFPSSFSPFTCFPALLKCEEGITDEVRSELAAKGHKVAGWPYPSWLAGGVCAVAADLETGVCQAGADPRRPSYAIA